MFRIVVFVALSALVACGGSEPAPAVAPAAVDAAPPAMAEHQHGEGVQAPEQPAVPEGARVFCVEPADGAKVTSPLTVKMGIEGMTVAKAGNVVAGEGHHHILIDDPASADAGVVVAMDERHIHYGDGSTETQLTLTPGEHTLTLQLADGVHRSYGAALRSTIHVTVE